MKPESQKEGKQPVRRSSPENKVTFTEELCSIPTELQRKIPLTFGWKFSPRDHKLTIHGDVAHDALALDSWISQEKDWGKHAALFLAS